MSPDVQQAFEAWFKPYEECWGDWKVVHQYDCLEAFEAGYNAAARLLVPVIENAAIDQSVGSRDIEAGDAGSSPAGSAIRAEDVYAAYPRKVGRSAAIKAIQKAGKGVGMERLLKAVKSYAEATSRWPVDERQYIPHPATWFNRGSYEDDPKEWERGNANVSQFSVTH